MRLTILLAAVAVLVAGCGMKTPSERTAYRIACQALKSDKTAPVDAEPKPIGEAELYIAKNLGCVRLTYEYADASGLKTLGNYTVWLRRVARTWMLERAAVTPQYGATQETVNGE